MILPKLRHLLQCLILNDLVDKESGLAPRTFVGPATFLLNSNSGSLRPTDNLDEGLL